MRSARTWFAIPAAVLAAVIAACAGGAPGSTGTAAAPTADAGRPQVVIQSPPANAQVVVGTAVEVVTTGVDAIGVGRIDLRVNGLAISSAETPIGGQQSFSAVHLWIPAVPGSVQLSAVAYRVDGAPSDEHAIAITVLDAGSSVAAYPTYGAALPSYRASAVPSDYAQPTYKANPTYGANPTYIAGATPTYDAGATPTYYAGATPTYVAATPTYGATPTYSASPTDQVAPPDAPHAFAIPFNGAAELSEYISYPGGDVEDVVNWSVTGMSQTPPQHAGTLNMFATCEGTGANGVRFKVGTQEFGCGEQIIVAQLVTFNSNTGQVKITATAAGYVRWTLNANVAPGQ
jgi:hypothetical protein